MGEAGNYLEWALFRTLDFIWGNGERAWRLFRFLFLVLMLMAVYDVVSYSADPGQIGSYWRSFIKSSAVFF
jgi:hypothetical protein